MISIKGLKTKAWKALSIYIRKRDKRCVTCGSPHSLEDLDCGHYQRNSERNGLLGGNELWFREENFGAQCTGCNRFRNGQPVEMALFLRKTWGDNILENINEWYRVPKKWTREEVEDVEKYYIQKTKEL